MAGGTRLSPLQTRATACLTYVSPRPRAPCGVDVSVNHCLALVHLDGVCCASAIANPPPSPRRTLCRQSQTQNRTPFCRATLSSLSGDHPLFPQGRNG